MKLVLFSVFIFASTIVSACPDLSGTYEQLEKSCGGKGYKDSTGWPLMQLKTTVVIEQKDCDIITISYDDPRYTTPYTHKIEIDLNQATKVDEDDNKLSARFYEKATTVTGLGGRLRASDTRKITFQKTKDGIKIDSWTYMKGFYNFVIPVLDKDSFNCSLKKI